jgi:enoyl-CoA hydratase
MAEDEVLYEVRDGIGWITLNRPEALNAVNIEVLGALSEILSGARSDRDVRAVVLTGAGERAFSAGADIKFLNKASPMEVRALARQAVDVTRRIELIGKPTAAAINGYALGGGLELAEACMFRMAVTEARLGHPEVQIGAVAAWGGTTRLPRLVGRARATELLLTGKQVTANEALAMGLVNRVVPRESLKKETESLLAEALSGAPPAVALSWEAMCRGLDASVEESLSIGVDCFGLAASTEDFREGTGAFIEKRNADWKNR